MAIPPGAVGLLPAVQLLLVSSQDGRLGIAALRFVQSRQKNLF